MGSASGQVAVFPPFDPSSQVPSMESLFDTSQDNEKNNLTPASNIWNIFNFNALPESSMEQRPTAHPESSELGGTSNIMLQKVTLSVPLLVHNLTRITLCFGNSPAYPRGLVDQAILSSLIDVAA